MVQFPHSVPLWELSRNYPGNASGITRAPSWLPQEQGTFQEFSPWDKKSRRGRENKAASQMEAKRKPRGFLAFPESPGQQGCRQLLVPLPEPKYEFSTFVWNKLWQVSLPAPRASLLITGADPPNLGGQRAQEKPWRTCSDVKEPPLCRQHLSSSWCSWSPCIFIPFSLPINKWASDHSSPGISDSRKIFLDHPEAFATSALFRQSH